MQRRTPKGFSTESPKRASFRMPKNSATLCQGMWEAKEASAFKLQGQSFMQAFYPGTSKENVPAREMSTRNPPCNGLGTAIEPNRPIQ